MKKLLLPLVLLVLAGVMTALYVRKQRELAAATARFDTERQELRTQVWDLNKRIKQLENELEAARSGSGVNPGVAAGRGGNAAVAARGGALLNNLQQMAGQILNSMTASLDSPETKRLLALQQRAQLDGQYAALFKSLNLPPEQLEQLKGLLVDRQSAAMDVLSAASAQGLNPLSSPEAIRDLARETQAKTEADIRALLGDNGFAQYQTYEQTQPQRAVADQLAQRLSYSATPLSEAQHEQVVQILAATSPTTGGDIGDFAIMANAISFAPQGGGNALSFGGPGNARATAGINNEAVNRAGTVLSAPQVAALQQLQQEQQAQQQVGQQLGRGVQRSLQLNLGGRGAAGGARGGN